MLKYKRSFFRFSYLISILLVLVSSIGVYRTSIVYDSLDAKIKNEKIVFGENKSINSMLKNVSGKYTIVKDIDSKKVGEVDFLINDYDNLSILPIEIKSGKNQTNFRAIPKLVDPNGNYKIPFGFVFGNKNIVKKENNLVTLPIYLIMFL